MNPVTFTAIAITLTARTLVAPYTLSPTAMIWEYPKPPLFYAKDFPCGFVRDSWGNWRMRICTKLCVVKEKTNKDQPGGSGRKGE